MNARTRPTRRVFLSGLAVTLSGCGVMSRIDQPIPLYNLVAPISFDHAFQALDKQLTVGIPIASADLDSKRIALSRQTGITEYFANAAWADNAPILIQSRLVEGFEISGGVPAVGPEAAGLRPDLVLQTELRDFEADYTGGGAAPVGHVRLSAKLITLPTRRIVHFQIVDQTEPAKGTSMLEIVRALDIATSRAIVEIVTGVLGAIT